MASAGTVTLNLDANSVKLLRELQKAQKQTQRSANKMRKSMGGAFKAIKSAVLSAGAVMAAFAAFRGFSRIAGEIDNIGKLVDRLGGSTEAFSELQFVAERSGLAFNTLTMGLQRMQRRVAEAANDMGEAQDALKELGISAKGLTRLDIDKQFELIANALNGVEDSGDRTRLAMKLFDSEGVALLQTMKNGAAGIQALRAEAQRLGISLSRDQVEAATKAKDAMTSLNAASKALGITLTNSLAPAITTLVEDMQRLFTGNSPVTMLADEMDQIRARLEKLGNKPIHAVEVEALLNRFGELAKQLQAIEHPAKGAGAAIEELSEIVVTVSKKTDIYGEDLAAFSKKFQTAEMRAEALRKTLSRFRKDLDPEQIKMIGDEINEILVGGIEEINTGPILKMKKVTKEATKEMSEYAKQAARNMQDAFADFLFDPFEDGLKGMLKSFLNTMRRMLANQMAAQIFGSLGGTGTTGFWASMFGGAKAEGGRTQSGKAYLVGEQGPEIMVPGAGTIIPNHAMGGNNYYFQAGADVATIRSEIIPMLEQTSDATVARMHEQRREGLF